MKAKILRDTTIDGLAEKINREFENSKAPFLQQVCTQYKTAVVPKMRGKEIVGHEVEYSALIFIEEVGEAKEPEKEAIRQQESWIYRPLSMDPDVERKLEAVKGNAPINGVVEPDFLEYLEKQFKRWKQLAENGVALGSREVAKLTDTIYGARLNARFGFEAVMHRGPDEEGQEHFTVLIYKNRDAAATEKPLYSFDTPIYR